MGSPHFVANPGRAITRDMLLRAAWKRPPVGRTRTVDRCVAKLRSKIETDAAAPKHLHTVRGVGYQFDLG
jgi:two-component system response regulator RegX3